MTPTGTTAAAAAAAGAAKQKVYWALFAAQPQPQLEIAAEPLTKKSHVQLINGSSGNMLQEASSIRFSQNFAWVLTQPDGSSAPSVLLIFSLPLTPSSKPLYYDTLEGALVGVHIQFDKHNNLWASAGGNNSVYEYSGDLLQQGGDLTPSLTLTAGLNGPQGLAFDPNGNLYIANGSDNDVAVFAQPIENKQPYYLDGINGPGGLAFDAHGNLYAASNNGATGAMAQYASGHLRSGDKPSVVDSTGIKANPYGSDLAFDHAGNLYDGDCGGTAGIYAYPLAGKKFSSKLAPAFYTNKGILSVGCVWGLAIH
jgi:DNA-binding beta-propeller fold protein YncE